MTKEMKLLKFWQRDKGGHITYLGVGVSLLTYLPLEPMGLYVKVPDFHMTPAKDDKITVEWFISNVMPDIDLPKIIRGLVFGDKFYAVDDIEQVTTKINVNNGYVEGLYRLLVHEVYRDKQR